jgi:hypothetical protein
VWLERKLLTNASAYPSAKFPDFGNGEGLCLAEDASFAVEYDQRPSKVKGINRRAAKLLQI